MHRQGPSEQPADRGDRDQLSRQHSPRLYVDLDRERAKALGVSISDIFDTMQAYFGNFYINDFIKSGRVYRVQTEADPEYRSSPDDIANLYVRAQNGKMIPLSAVITTEFTSGPDPVTHFNGLNSALLLGSAAPGYSSGQTLDAVERLAKEVLQPDRVTNSTGAESPIRNGGGAANRFWSSGSAC
ncbi:MAG: efflux RND transporter permease subunit [Candidatus Manganitrophus sp.]|nr:MAG: efflux RND transporter permease subunit [Candidatus Manganitrophus sp.]